MAGFADTREYIPHMPKKGDWLLWKHDHHAIYTDFSDGVKVDAEAIGIDWHQSIEVTGCKADKCWRLQHDGKTWVVEW